MAHTTSGAMKTPTQSSSVTENMHHPRSPTHQHDIDMEAELGIQPVRRPTDIEHDVNDLGQKKRVSSVLCSPLFKEELETVVTDLLRSGDGGGHVIAREIANMLSPLNRSQYSLAGETGMLGVKTGVGCVSPINDITGSDTSQYNKGEKLMRCKLAALYRLVDLNGWSQSIYNHISLRVAQEQEHFLINPFGLLYHEVSASKLIKINMQGDVVDQGTTTFTLNKAGFIIHSAIHSGRPDIKCIIHVHTPDVVAVSMMKCGLLPLSQESMIVGEISYHNYQGIVIDAKEKKLLIKHLGPNNKVMFLRNHGLLVCGETVEEAYHYLYNVMLACQAQIKAMSAMDHEKLNHLDKSVMKKTLEIVSSGQDEMITGANDIKWGIGEMMFEANMRMLDNMGYRTGYSYRNVMMLQRKSRMKSDIELPADFESDIKLSLKHRSLSQDHSRWINSPNQYTKVKAGNEDGTAPDSGAGSVNGDVSPKSRTKWKYDSTSSHSTPIRISDANQFVPKNTDPREVAEKRKKIRGQGRWDENCPGPQSQKLEGVLPERRGPHQDGVVTASKGIIQRDYHSRTIVAGPPNPFRQDDREVEAYQAEVAKKISWSENEPEVAAEQESNQNTPPEIGREGDVIDGTLKNDSQYEKPEEMFAHTEEIHVHEVQVSTVSSPAVKSIPAKNNVDPGVTEAPKPEKIEAPVTARPQQKEEQAPKPVETKKEQPSQKSNGKGSTEVIAPKAAAETSPAPEPEKTPDAKGKQKKNKNRRSLSFLKKKKDKKEKE